MLFCLGAKMVDAVGLWVIVYSCMTSVKPRDMYYLHNGDHQYDIIALKIVSTQLPNNLMLFIVKIIMKIISSDIT